MVTIRLLGKPLIQQDGRPERSPRGRKAWALLGYLALLERPPSRQRVAAMLFGDAEDPLGALRWTLAELRRCIGGGLTLDGDPLVLTTGPGVSVDALALLAGPSEPSRLLELDGELLEGVELSANEAFDSWLVVERHRIAALLEARLRQAAIALLATGRAGEAIAYAARAVALNPLEEGNRELLIRSLAMSGDRAAASREAAIADDLMMRELGVRASAVLHDAATTESDSHIVPLLGGRAAAISQLDAGTAAIAAGAVEAGLQCLRRAVAEAHRCQDGQLEAQALACLGGALVHAARGRDEEGAILLNEAIELAVQTGDRATAVTAYRELGFVEVQAGRRATAETSLRKAETDAETDEELAAILGVRGMNASDRGDYPTAFEHLRASVEYAERCDDRRQQAWSLSLVGRAHLLRGERNQAVAALSRSIELVYDERWMAFLPWPQTLRAEIDLMDGNSDLATEALERAWHLARQLNDACWEGMAARGLGLVNASLGRHAEADQWLAEAAARSNRIPDRYQWVRAHVLDTMIASTLDRDAPGDKPRSDPARSDPARSDPAVADRVPSLVESLARLAARCDMRELVVRAQLHRYHLGDRTALESARLLAQDVDNPALHALLPH